MKIHVLTGGPCSGKTTVLVELLRRGWPVISEVARAVLDEGRARGVAPPGFEEFQIEVLRRQIDAECLARETGRDHFADRGTLDNVAYCRAYHHSVPDDLAAHAAAHRAGYSTVFLLDRLPYVQDGGRVRGEDDELASRVHEELARVYAEHGYEVVRVPVVPVGERADLIERWAAAPVER